MSYILCYKHKMISVVRNVRVGRRQINHFFLILREKATPLLLSPFAASSKMSLFKNRALPFCCTSSWDTSTDMHFLVLVLLVLHFLVLLSSSPSPVGCQWVGCQTCRYRAAACYYRHLLAENGNLGQQAVGLRRPLTNLRPCNARSWTCQKFTAFTFVRFRYL